jgi:hypothetical protein
MDQDMNRLLTRSYRILTATRMRETDFPRGCLSHGDEYWDSTGALDSATVLSVIRRRKLFGNPLRRDDRAGLACVKVEHFEASGQVGTWTVSSAISPLLHLHPRKSRMSKLVAGERPSGGDHRPTIGRLRPSTCLKLLPCPVDFLNQHALFGQRRPRFTGRQSYSAFSNQNDGIAVAGQRLIVGEQAQRLQ